MVAIKDAADAIKARLKQLDLSQAEFSKRVGKSTGWAGARFLPSVDTMIRYLAYKEPETLDRILKVLEWTPQQFIQETGLNLPGFFFESMGSLQPGERVSKLRFFIEPVRGLASAGRPVDADGMPVLADVWRRGSLLYQVEGDSMAPTLNDGDRVYVDPSDSDIREGRVYVFEIPGDGHTIKRVRRLDDGELWLVSDNPKYRPWRPSEMRVIGRVYYHDPAGGRM